MQTPAADRAGGTRSEVRLIDFFRTTCRYWPGTILLVDVAFGISMTVPFVFLASYVDREGLQLPGLSVIGFFFWCYAGWGLVTRLAMRQIPDRIGRRNLVGFEFALVHLRNGHAQPRAHQ